VQSSLAVTQEWPRAIQSTTSLEPAWFEPALSPGSRAASFLASYSYSGLSARVRRSPESQHSQIQTLAPKAGAGVFSFGSLVTLNPGTEFSRSKPWLHP